MNLDQNLFWFYFCTKFNHNLRKVPIKISNVSDFSRIKLIKKNILANKTTPSKAKTLKLKDVAKVLKKHYLVSNAPFIKLF